MLAILGLGDLTVTQTALLVLDISDKPFASWLPVSQLTVAAVPLVVGMLVAAHFLGEAIKARRYERAGLRQVIIAVVSLAGGVLLAVSVADIRIAYMAALGVATIAWPFVCLQLGLFCVAVAASTWAAHPFHAEFKAASRGVKTAEGKARRARRRAHDRAGAVNRLAERHLTLVDEAAAGGRGILTTGQRQVCIYRRSYLLASAGASRPAPASLFTGAPEEKLPSSRSCCSPKTAERRTLFLAPLERASLDDVDHDARAYLQDQMQHEADINQETADRGQHAPAALSSAAYTLNGKSPDGSAPGNAPGWCGRQRQRPGRCVTMPKFRIYQLQGMAWTMPAPCPPPARRLPDRAPVWLPGLTGQPTDLSISWSARLMSSSCWTTAPPWPTAIRADPAMPRLFPSWNSCSATAAAAPPWCTGARPRRPAWLWA